MSKISDKKQLQFPQYTIAKIVQRQYIMWRLIFVQTHTGSQQNAQTATGLYLELGDQ